MFRPVPLLPFILITGCAVLLALLTAISARRGTPRLMPGAHLLLVRYGPGVQWAVLAAAALIPVAITIGVRSYRPASKDVPTILGLYVLVVAVTLPMVWEAGRLFVLVTPEGLEGRSPWHGIRTIRWDDLESVGYSSLNAWFAFRGPEGRTIRVFGFVAGMTNLLQMVEDRVPAAALKPARTGYARLGRPFPVMPDEPILEARPPR
jgi:hypothetical protein